MYTYICPLSGTNVKMVSKVYGNKGYAVIDKHADINLDILSCKVLLLDVLLFQ